jgi:hypothetical protein
LRWFTADIRAERRSEVGFRARLRRHHAGGSAQGERSAEEADKRK